MKLVIDIPDNIYDAIKSAKTIVSGQRSGKTLLQILVSSVENGTPLEEIPNPCIECSQNCCVSDLNGEKCSCQKIYVLAESEEG